MNRRTLLEGSASAVLLTIVPNSALAARSTPWEKLRRALDGRLLKLQSPFAQCATNASACDALFENLKNPYYIGDHPEVTQSLGWADAWTSATSPYCVAAEHAGDIAAAVNFAREYDQRIAIKGGGHSYLGTSNAPDSLLVWTRHMNGIEVGSDSVKLGAGCIWARAYDEVTTKHGKYVQGGGCATVGVAGLVQSGGFGSYSKQFGTAASSLLEAEVVTADGKIRTVNASNDPDLLWALKGGGGGTFAIVSNLALMLHPLPEFFGVASLTIDAANDDAYLELIRRFMAFYQESLFNEHWGESVHFRPNNKLTISMNASGLSDDQLQKLWQPFVAWVKSSPNHTLEPGLFVGSYPARDQWNEAAILKAAPSAIAQDPRTGNASNWWWSGDGDQVGIFWAGYESLWMPAALLQDSAREDLVKSIFSATRYFGFAFHFNKGLAGGAPDAIERTNQTAMNPKVLDAFALAICATGKQGLYPGVPGREPDLTKARAVAARIHACVDELRHVAPDGGSYVSESNYFEPNYGHSYFGTNYPRLQAIKKRYDPHNFFRVRNGVMP